MATPPQTLQLRAQEAPGLGNALQPVNRLFQQLTTALSGRLTLSENSNATIKTVSIGTADPWVTATYQNGWATFAAGREAKFTKLSSGLVVIEGDIKSGTIGAVAFNLPAAYRPAPDLLNFAPWSNTTTVSRLLVTNTGDVFPFVGVNSEFSVCCSFMAADTTPDTNLSSPVTFPHGLQGRCTDVLVSSVTASDGSLVPPFQLNATDDGNGNVVISAVPGLAGPKTYALRLICLGEPS